MRPVHETKKFIRHLWHYIKGKVKGFIVTRDAKARFTGYFWFMFNLLLTGIIIQFIIESWDSGYRFLGFGLLSAIIMFYLKWLKKLLIARTNDDIDKL